MQAYKQGQDQTLREVFEEKQLDEKKSVFEKKNDFINVVVKPSKISTGNYGFDDIGFLTPDKSLSIEK